MDTKLQELLARVVNPATGKSLVEEQRITSCKEEFGQLVIEYKRDEISPLDKREIEKQIAQVFGEHFPIENIKVLTISERSQEVYKNLNSKSDEAKEATSAPKESANLKVGHGSIGQKKKVPGVSSVIAVASGKGGVGKSTFSANLAISLKNQGLKVGLIDADIYGPSLPMILGKRDVKPFSNSEKKIIPVNAHGISFISFGLFISEEEPVIWRGPMLGGVLNQFLFDVDWSGHDVLIIDLPPGTGDIQLSMIQSTSVDGVVVISTPQDVALLDATKGLEMFRKVEIPILGLVENMSSFICDSCDKEHFIFGSDGVKKASQKLGVDYLGSIPIDIELRRGSDRGVPFMSNKENESKLAWKRYEAIAFSVSDRLALANKENKGFFSKLFRT